MLPRGLLSISARLRYVFLKFDGLDPMSPEFRNVGNNAGLRKQSSNLRSHSSGRNIFLVYGAAQNLPHLFLHAAAITNGATLKPQLDRIFNVTNHKLSHENLLHLLCDIMISRSKREWGAWQELDLFDIFDKNVATSSALIRRAA